MLGVWLAQYVPSEALGSASWLLVAIVIIGVCFWKRYMYLLLPLVIAGALLGVYRGTLQQSDLSVAAVFFGQTHTVTGTVREDVDINTAGKSVIRLGNLMVDGTNIAGSAWITSKSDSDIKRGDIVSVSGKVEQGFGTFVLVMYDGLVTQVQRPQPGDVARQARDWFADGVRTAIPAPQSSLGIGYLVGQKRALPADLIEALQIVGLTHVVVASGYNLTILVRLARRLFEKISKYLAALSSSGMILAFIAVTGLSPSMSRAGLVAGLALAAWYYGRKFHPVILLLFAAAVTVVVNPSYAWGDLGWQLSFAAFGGVMILAPLLQRYFFGEQPPGFLRRIMFETLSAIIATAPILIGAFGQFSNVALIANMLVVPLVPLAMLLTFIAGVGALLFPAAATLVGLPATWLLTYMIGVADYFAGLSWAVTPVELPQGGVAVCYGLIIAVCFYLWRVTRYDLRDSNIVV